MSNQLDMDENMEQELETTDTPKPRALPARYNTRRFNVYKHGTNELVDENILIHPYCKSRGLDRSNLLATLEADRTVPSSRNNRHQHKGYYLEEVRNN